MIETIASKHNLVCRQTVFNSILTSTLFVGFTVGSALGGYLSDKYGQVENFIFDPLPTQDIRIAMINGLISPDEMHLDRYFLSAFPFYQRFMPFSCLVQMTFEKVPKLRFIRHLSFFYGVVSEE